MRAGVASSFLVRQVGGWSSFASSSPGGHELLTAAEGRDRRSELPAGWTSTVHPRVGNDVIAAPRGRGRYTDILEVERV